MGVVDYAAELTTTRSYHNRLVRVVLETCQFQNAVKNHNVDFFEGLNFWCKNILDVKAYAAELTTTRSIY